MHFFDVYQAHYTLVQHAEGKKGFVLVFKVLQMLWSLGPELGALPQAPGFSVRPLPDVLTRLSHAHLNPTLLQSHITSLGDSGRT